MEAKDLLIREITGNDRKMVEEFFAGHGEETTFMFNSSGGNTKAALSYVDGDTENRIYWLAEEETEGGKRIAGYVFLWNLHKSVAWFGIAVADDWKGRRLGTRLIRHAIDYCKDNGYGAIMLTTRFENVNAQRLYEKNGFERIGKYSDGSLEYLYIHQFDR